MIDTAILITTMFRDNLLKECVSKALQYLPENTVILVGDQGENQDLEKITRYSEPPCFYYQLPFDCGLSAARNILVQKAIDMGCKYVILSADSLIFNEKTKDVRKLIPVLETFDLIGMHTTGNTAYWVGDLKFIPKYAFEMTFADRQNPDNYVTNYGMKFLPCTCVENFFIARAETLADIKWDEQFKLAEHEDFMYRYAQKYILGWTREVSCDYVRQRTERHGEFRKANFAAGLQSLYAKYKINQWIYYKRLDLAKVID